MEKSTKWILAGSTLLGGFALLSATRLTRFSKEFLLDVTPRIHSIDWTRLVLAVDITFKNPTDATLRLKHPTVTAFDSLASKQANLPFITSTISGKVYSIGANTETRLEPVMLSISVLDFGLLKTVFNLARTYLTGGAITLYVRALTQVNGTIPVVQESQVSFQRGQKDKVKPLPKPLPKPAPKPVSAVTPLTGFSPARIHPKRRYA